MNNSIKHSIKKAPKTGAWRNMRPEVAAEKCIGCGTCVKFCPEACIQLTNNLQLTTDKKNKKIAEVDYDWCKGCGVCANVCPAKAILMKKE